MPFLAVILFLPCFFVLGGLFVLFPRARTTPARTAFNTVALLLALVLSVLAMLWGYAHADAAAGPIWKQVLATLFAYAAFVASLLLALVARLALLRHGRELTS